MLRQTSVIGVNSTTAFATRAVAMPAAGGAAAWSSAGAAAPSVAAAAAALVVPAGGEDDSLRSVSRFSSSWTMSRSTSFLSSSSGTAHA